MCAWITIYILHTIMFLDLVMSSAEDKFCIFENVLVCASV